MGFLMLLVLGVTFYLMYQSSKSVDGPSWKNEVVAVKQCPPHKWQYVEVKDTEGNTAKWKIVCDICGPMVVEERPKNGDYS